MLIVEAPIVERKILPSLTLEQLDQIIERASNVRDKAIISSFADTGLRLSELVNIDPRNIDWQNRLIEARCEGNKERYAPFGERSESLLREWLSQYREKVGYGASSIGKLMLCFDDRCEIQDYRVTSTRLDEHSQAS